MNDTEAGALSLMFFIGATPLFFYWFTDEATTRRRRALKWAWAIFWMGPPMFKVWTMGVLGGAQ